ncbi:hypothetical protein FE394_02720 [Xenorhabdus sp. Reich]|uniref:Immunity protein CdiI n=1 Tax=Xenorhabdus littoralis TaxID=2582835 RepID=A0ABU4SHL4_9GAMM|nr:hypothetical protein [Xenorhabdus sp. Reich]MDX7998136.1 hypothetical protein [Xenorhabdus sp. Reich]
MSGWTGELYGFYTNKSIEKIFEVLKKEISNIDYQYEYNSHDGEESLFFYKDKNMLEHHLEVGYNTDIDGQGCFCIEARVVNLHGIASLFEFETQSDFEPYDINLLLDNVFYYVLVVPDFIENSTFCSKIHRFFIDVVKNIR